MGNPILAKEIEEAVSSWPNNKSPGPDGFTGEFYKNFMPQILPDLLKVFTTITNNQTSLAPLDRSYIILLPKQEAPSTPSNFRPISLLHGVHKIFSKILANRLQQRLQELINETQTGFLKNRTIIESYMYAHHVLHHAKKVKTPIALFKADIHKAFDTVSWDFILQILDKIGFPSQWHSWIKNTVLVGTSQIMINGLLGKKIILKRGVRQGDPLSPLLFIVAMDFLARYFQKLTDSGAIRLPFENMKPCLIYADDALFFVKLETQQIQALTVALTVFERVSELQINNHKSELILPQENQTEALTLANIIGCKAGSLPFTYLGLPLSNKALHKST